MQHRKRIFKLFQRRGSIFCGVARNRLLQAGKAMAGRGRDGLAVLLAEMEERCRRIEMRVVETTTPSQEGVVVPAYRAVLPALVC